MSLRGGHNKISKKTAEARGTYRPDRHDHATVEADPLQKLPKPPMGFTAWQKAFWKETAALMAETNVLTASDLHSLRNYVEAETLRRKAFEDVDENGFVLTVSTENGEVKKANPAHAALKDYASMCLAFQDRYGFSAKARAQIKIEKKTKKSDPFADMMKSGQISSGKKYEA